MKFFEEPIVKVQQLVVEDVITTSKDPNEPTKNPNETPDDWS